MVLKFELTPSTLIVRLQETLQMRISDCEMRIAEWKNKKRN